MFNFAWAWAFFILPLPLVVYFLIPKTEKESSALFVPFYENIDKVTQGQHRAIAANRGFSLIALGLIWIALVIAAARPQWVDEPVEIPTSGRDLLVAVDISGSMKERDMVVEGQQIPRILVVKHVVGEFLKRRESDRLGLILFGTHAYLQAPLTFDRNTVNMLLQEAQLGFAGPQTAIGDAIGLSIKRLQDRPATQRVLILLTDGANSAGEVMPRQAADLAKQAGVKIYTIGVGANEMIVQSGLFGNFNRKVNPSADLDEDTLRYIAETTGGQYFRAHDPQELAAIYQELDKLEPIEQKAETFRPVSALYYWPLSIAFILSLAIVLKTLLASFFVTFRSTQ